MRRNLVAPGTRHSRRLRGLVALSLPIMVAGALAAPHANAAARLPSSHALAVFDSTYRSLAARVTKLGYAPTSLTGYYGNMYTRDASVNAMTLILGGDLPKARAILRYILRYSAATGQPRLPHRIYQETNTPVSGGQTTTSARAADLSTPASRSMPAPGMVSAVDVYLSRTSAARGSVRAVLTAAGTTVDTQLVPVSEIPPGGGWVTVKFLPPTFATTPAGYTLRLQVPGTPKGSVTWWGAGHGNAAYRERVTDFHLSGYDMYDETDQAYSVVLAWARYVAAKPDDSAFVQETWPWIRKYVDYYLETPGYLHSGYNLIRNPILDDEGYHNTYDLLTNVVTSQALHELAPIASRLGHGSDATRWTAVSRQLERGINSTLVTTEDGHQIYGMKIEVAENNKLYAGHTFVNLAPIAFDWYATDNTLMANTLDSYLRHNSRSWSGETMLSSMKDYAFTGHNDWVLTKGLAWEWRFDLMTGNRARLDTLDSFLRAYDPDTAQPVAEGWVLDSAGKLIMTDPGNQEHASWYAVQLLEGYPGLRSRARTLNAQLRGAPTLTGIAPSTVARSTAFTVNATLFNTTDSAIDFETPTLQVPSGWTVTAHAAGGHLVSGDPASFTWTVTPSATASGTAQLGITIGTTKTIVRSTLTTTVVGTPAAAVSRGLTGWENRG